MEGWSNGALCDGVTDVLQSKRQTLNVERYFWNNPRTTEPIIPPAVASVALSPTLPR
jgi:hypothetical protein